MFKLQSGVPVPKTIRPSARGKRRKYPFEQMEVGHFFFVPGKRATQIRAYFHSVGRDLGIKLKAREAYMHEVKGKWELCEDGDTGATLGVGVWRVE